MSDIASASARPPMPPVQWGIVRSLILKDLQLSEKALAAYALAGILALGLIGLAKPWAFYIGSLLLLILLVAVACMSISNALLTERKEQTLAFVMSLPVSPLEFTLAKLGGNALTFLVPFLILLGGTVGVTLRTPVPDGFIVFATLVYGHVLVGFSVSLAVAMSVRSEGWNIFVMIASQVLINPFLMALGQIPSIRDVGRGEAIVWSAEALLILGAQLLVSVLAIAFTAWWHGRKAAFE